jgi:DHA3 family tetracycline resistance protein-like MFS transporter
VNHSRAYRVYLLMEAVNSFLFAVIFTMTAVYRVQTVHMDPFQLVLTGTVMEAAIFICEVPTGIVADTFSRKWSIIIGVIILGLASVFEGSVPQVWAVLLAQAIWGLGYTFTSGATEAWIAGEVGDENLTQVYLRAGQFGRVGGLLGIGVSVALGSLAVALPVVLGGLAMAAFGLLLAVLMPETGFQRGHHEEAGSLQQMARTLRSGASLVRGRPLLITLMALAAVYGATSEGIDRLNEAHFIKDIGLPAFTLPGDIIMSSVIWFGVMDVGATLLSLAATAIMRRRLKTEDAPTIIRAMFLLSLGQIVAVTVFGLALGLPLALAAFWASTILRTLRNPIYSAWLARQIDPQVRATVLSMNSQMDAIGQVVGGPVIGAIGSLVSLPAALVFSALLLVPALPLTLRARGQSDPPAPVPDPEAAVSPS